MINMALAMEKFALYAGMEQEEAQKWRPLTSSSLQKLENGLKEGTDANRHNAILAAAAAADAFYRYCLLENSRTDSWVTAGSVSVKVDHKARIASAAQVRDEAFLAVSHLMKDEGFAFLRT